MSGEFSTSPSARVREAEQLADAADERAGIRTREATASELEAVLARFEATWGEGRGPDRSMVQALAYAGNTVLVAVPNEGPAEPVEFAEPAEASPGALPSTGSGSEPPAEAREPRFPSTGSARVLGATLGFLGWSGGVHLHSHMNAVDPAHRGRGIGIALKLRQRAICLANGVDEMRWTYDPLIRRNAHLNLVRLGAEVVAFHPDFYGVLDDRITGSDRSDRFEVRWRLESPRTLRAIARHPRPEWRSAGGLALVADFERLRADDPAAAARVRGASRDAFAVLADGVLRPELDDDGDYVFTADDPDREAER